MGSAVMASKTGLYLDLLCDKFHAKKSEIQNKMAVVMEASLKEIRKGVNSNAISFSNTFNLQNKQLTCFDQQGNIIPNLEIHSLRRSVCDETLHLKILYM